MDTLGFDKVAEQIPPLRDRLFKLPQAVKEGAFDIHLKSGQPVSICGREGVFFIRETGETARAPVEGLIRVSSAELQEIFFHLCSHSVFSHEEEIRRGYVRVGEAYRAGICGTAVIEQGHVKTVRDISSIVFRIPREVRGCGDRLFLERPELRGGVLVIGEPSSGKTTFLRDVVRSLSVGKFGPCKRVAVIDERGEIGGNYDLGPCADVLKGYPKGAGFDTAIRMLSPEVIVCDELGDGDLETVKKSVFAGVELIATVHAGRKDYLQRRLCRQLLESGAFGTVVVLSGRSQPGEIEAIESVEEGFTQEGQKSRGEDFLCDG